MGALSDMISIFCISIFSVVFNAAIGTSHPCTVQHVGPGRIQHARPDSIQYVGPGDQVHLDCHHKYMTQVPAIKSLGPKINITSLDLSWNNVTKLSNHSFHDFPNLRILNLSHAGIQSIADSAFHGLFNLQILDLTNNFMTKEQGLTLHAHAFKDCLVLNTLILTNVQLWSFAPLANLQKLQELKMTPNDSTMPYNLKNLPQLKVVYFAFCDFLNQTLTKQMLRPLAEFKALEQLTFHSCHIRWLDDGIFDGFSKLILLNFAQNENLPFKNVLQVLSSDTAPKVQSLIIDSVGNRQPNPLLLEAKNGCSPFWMNLENLAMRNTQLFGFRSNFAHCFSSLRSIALGFNNFFSCGVEGSCGKIIAQLFWNARSVDISYGQARDNRRLHELEGRGPKMGWVPNNKGFFPSVLDTSVPCELNQNKTFTFPRISVELSRCSRIFSPPCLSYIRADHSVFIDSYNLSRCVIFSNNQLTFLNVSNRYGYGNISISSEIYGLRHLEIFDASNTDLMCLAQQSMQNLSSLKILYLDNNHLGKCRNRLEFPQIPLVELHLAKNYIEKLALNELTSLRYLDLSENKLTSISFLNPNLRTLKILNVAGNKLTQILPIHTDLLDRLFQNESDFQLVISGNPIQCQCDQLDFITWFQKTPINIRSRMAIQCETSSDVMNIMQIDVGKLIVQCTHINKKHFRIIISSIVTGIIVFLTLAFSLLYRYRWHIRWKYYKICYNKKVSRGELILNELANEVAFCTYLIFPEGQGQVQAWTTDILYTKLTEDWGRSVYLPRRHDMLGDSINNNIAAGVLQSSTALWVICPEFLEDGQCEMAANFAFQHLGASQNLLIIYEHVDETRLPRGISNLMNTKVGIPRVRYTLDEAGLEMFWARLDQFVPALQVRNFHELNTSQRGSSICREICCLPH